MIFMIFIDFYDFNDFCASHRKRANIVCFIKVFCMLRDHGNHDFHKFQEFHTISHSGAVWRSLAESGAVWRSLAQSGAVWRSLAESGGRVEMSKYSMFYKAILHAPDGGNHTFHDIH